MDVLQYVLLIIFALGSVTSQCTFPSPFVNSTWLDSTRGTLVFTSTEVSGWDVTILNQQVSSWTCYDSSSNSRLVLKSASTILYSTVSIDVYACLVLTKITDNSYTYVQKQIQEPDAGYHRLLLTNQASVLVSAICNSAASIPTLEFHVLVKQGMGASAAISFPNNLLASVDYEYRESDGTVACNGTQETLDMCTDQTQLAVNYSYCPQEIAYTAGGRAWCVAKKSLSGYDCAVVMNQDTTISGTARQFACICSNGNKMSVVANNCTANQRPASYPTAPDGSTVIGYLLHIKQTFVSCAPAETDSSSSNIGLIVGIVIAVLVIIAIVIISFILYKTGRCIIICGHVKGCLKKAPCCNKNKVAESEKPILTNGNTPRTETINETASSARPRRSREKSAVSAISRSSTMGVNREKSDVDKSLISRHATATSIGLDLKSEKSTVHTVKVKSAEAEEKTEKDDTKKESVLSFLPCFRGKDVHKEQEPEVKEEEKVETKPESKGKKKATATKGKKGAAGKKGAGKKAKADTDKKGKKAKQTTVKSEETPDDEAPEEEPTLKEAPNVESPRDAKKGKKVKEEKKAELVRAPTKMNTDLHLTSTPVPGSEKGKKGVVSVPAALVKPEDKRTEWTFLSCCFGNRSPPPPDEDSPPEVNEAPIVSPRSKKKAPSKTDKKGKGSKKGGGGGKSGGKKGGKTAGKKPDVNGNDVVVEDITDEIPFVERSKSMPEKQREKTTLSLKDAEKVKVDVYIPDDKTNLHLKDTVIVKEKNGEPQLIKAKTDIGLVRPASSSSRPASSIKTKKPETKKGKKSGEKSKGGAKSSGKDKKKKKK